MNCKIKLLFTGLYLVICLQGIGQGIILNYDHMGNGGEIIVNDEMGNDYVKMQPNFNGEGGFFSISRNATSSGFFLDGNYNNSNNTTMIVAGSNRSMIFLTSESGNSSVILPINSISQTEILNEAGVAGNNNSNGGGLNKSLTVMESATITAPSAGYVLALASCELADYHIFGESDITIVGISKDTTSLPVTMDVANGAGENAFSNQTKSPIMVQGVFTVTAGAQTFYFLGRESADALAGFRSPQLSLVFIPTNYGAVSSNLASTVEAESEAIYSPANEVKLSEVLRESNLANQERMQREIEEYRALIAEYKVSLNKVGQRP